MENTELKELNKSLAKLIKKNIKNQKRPIDELNSITCPVCLGIIAYQNEDGTWTCPVCGSIVNVC